MRRQTEENIHTINSCGLPNQKLGLQVNDEVLSINNISSSSFKDYCAFRAFIDTLDSYDIINIIVNKNNEEILFDLNYKCFMNKED